MISNLVCNIEDSSFYKIYISDDHGLTTYLMVRSNLVTDVFEWGKLLQSHLTGKTCRK